MRKKGRGSEFSWHDLYPWDDQRAQTEHGRFRHATADTLPIWVLASLESAATGRVYQGMYCERSLEGKAL
jgi:hypothetical protein